MVGKNVRVVMVMGVVAILFLTSVLGQEPTAERRIAQGPGRNGKTTLFFFTPCIFSAESPD